MSMLILFYALFFSDSTRTETKHLISDLTRQVPFRLVTPKGNSIRIDKPLAFDSIRDQLEVTHVQFSPNVTSTLEKIIDTLIGKVSTGIETKEEMLLINAPITGLGRLQKRSGNWYLIPHERWSGILTRSSRDELLSKYRSHSNFAQFLTILFGITASCTAIYLFYRYQSKRTRRIHQLPPIPPAIHQNLDDNPTNLLQCVICLENEVMYSLQPCSHLGLCHSCARQLQSRSSERDICPICRRPIEQYQRVYLQ